MASHSFHTVGFIGLGVMGEPMCANLHAKSGCTVLAFDADPATLARAREAGMTVAEELRELAEHAEVIFTSLPGGPELTAVVEELLPHLWHGQIFVDTSTAPVTRTRELATRLAEEGVVYLDAPIARTRQAAREGTLATMVGGPAEAFERVHALLACYASDIIHCGAVGCGQIVKLMNNMVLVETVNALSEALTIARRAGMDGEVLFQALSKGSADSFALRNHGMKALLPGRFPKRAFSVRYARKDLAYALELAGESGVTARGAELAAALLDTAAQRGLTDAYWPALLAVVDDTLHPEIPEEG